MAPGCLWRSCLLWSTASSPLPGAAGTELALSAAGGMPEALPWDSHLVGCWSRYIDTGTGLGSRCAKTDRSSANLAKKQLIGRAMKA
jgi:hypothetical protein